MKPFKNFWIVPATALCFSSLLRTIIARRNALTLFYFFYSSVSYTTGCLTSSLSCISRLGRSVSAISFDSSFSLIYSNSVSNYFFSSEPNKCFSIKASLLSISFCMSFIGDGYADTRSQSLMSSRSPSNGSRALASAYSLGW